MCLDGSINDLTNSINSLFSTREEIVSRLSSVDQKNSDINHILEIANFNVCEGYKLAKKQQDILRKRREIKYELQRVDKIIGSVGGFATVSKLEKAKEFVYIMKDEKEIDGYTVKSINREDSLLKLKCVTNNNRIRLK